MTPRLVLFDCDGTLVDSQASIIAAMTAAFGVAGLGVPDPAAVRAQVGLPIETAVGALLPVAPAPLRAEIGRLYRQAFFDQRAAGLLDDPLYPGIVGALDAIAAAGFLLGVATGKSRRGLDAILDHHGIAARFATLQTHDHGPGKPHPAMVLRALEDTGAAAAATVVVGDTLYDITMAHAAGARAVGVGWGYHAPESLAAAGADLMVEAAAELPEAILRLLGPAEAR
jgi:phosphoglycolate phosphatase